MSEKAEIGVEIVCDGGVVVEREVNYNGISGTKIKLNPWAGDGSRDVGPSMIYVRGGADTMAK